MLPPYVQVSGRVLDAEGNGLAGVSVRAQADMYSIVRVTTDATGHYRFAVVAAASYQITLTPAVGSGYLARIVSNVDLSSDQAGGAFRLAIDPDPDPDPDPSYDESLPVWLLYYVNKQRANSHADRC